MRRCCAPSWRLRSRRRRSAYAASTSRRARSPQPRCERLALGDDRGQTERRQRGNTDEELRGQDAARDRVEVEGPYVVGGVPDREARADRDRERAAARSEAERRPEENREQHVGQRTAAGHDQLAQRDDRREEKDGLARTSDSPVAHPRAVPRDRQRDDDQRAGRIAEPPRAPHGREPRGSRSLRRAEARATRRSR